MLPSMAYIRILWDSFPTFSRITSSARAHGGAQEGTAEAAQVVERAARQAAQLGAEAYGHLRHAHHVAHGWRLWMTWKSMLEGIFMAISNKWLVFYVFFSGKS